MSDEINKTDDRPVTEYLLTWPSSAPAVCTIGGQWQRTDSGEIEAWYTQAQLRLCLVAMERARRALSSAAGAAS